MSLKLIDVSDVKTVSGKSTGRPIFESPITGIADIDDGVREEICRIIKDIGIERIERIEKAHRIGYACVNMSIDATTNKTCRLDNCNGVRLRDLISSNLSGMRKIIEWNIAKGIMLYRISSVVIPYASHDVNKVPWWNEYKGEIANIGEIIKDSGMRVSMHPGQYVNINSPDPSVVDFSIKELEYHAKFMDLLGLGDSHRMILHIGGGYGDKQASIKRFLDVWSTLSGNIKSRLTIENDDKIYNVWDVLKVSSITGAPVIFDVLHHQINYNGHEKNKDIKFILEQCFSTWSKGTGIPKIHVSTQKPNARYGVHAESIDMNLLMTIYFGMIDYDFDIMLETKDKDISVLRAFKILEDIKNGKVSK